MNTSKAFLITTLVATILTAPAEVNSQGEIPTRLREIYVPHEEFLERASQDPDGVIMELDEYRALVLKGIVESKKRPETQLPPLEAVVIQSEHRGKLSGKTARFTSTIQIRVTRAGWVRCPLDPIPAALGSIKVNGKPGWLLRSVPKTRQKKVPQAINFLLLKGKGTHTVELTFSLGAIESEDYWRINGSIPRAESGLVLLDVPGYADATSTPPNLQVSELPDGAGSRLSLSLGSSAGFSITWRMKMAIGKSGSILSALNGMTLLPRIDDPLFTWRSEVNIQRRKTDALSFIEPPGTRVVSVRGGAVHSWLRQDETIRVLLKEPTMGKVAVVFDGILTGQDPVDETANERSYIVGPPQLAEAFSNSGYIAICRTDPERLDVKAQEATEVSLKDGVFPPLEKTRQDRCFSYTSQDARLTLTARGRDRAFECRSAGLVRVLESGVTLDSIYHIDMIRGKEYRFNVTLPRPWNLIRLQGVTRGKGAPQRELSWEVVSTGEDRVIEIDLKNSVSPGEPLVLSFRLEHMDFPPDISWPQRQLEFSIPHFIDSEKSKTDVGVKLPDSMFAIVADLPGWETMKSDALRRAGFTSELDEESGLAAGLTSTTGQASQPVSLTLNHRRPMGEYQCLTHLLALEGRVRSRNDIRLAIVDRAIDVLRVHLPIGADVHAPITGVGIKEVLVEAAENGGSIRVIRYARPWTGTREIRIEFEALTEELPGTAFGRRVPWLKIVSDPEAPLAPVFDGDRQVVFQSLGAVKIEVTEGAELASTHVDELPELGQPWKEGRILFAYQFKSLAGPDLPAASAPASFNIIPFDRAKVLGIISREMELTTVIDPGGSSRTRMEAVIAYNKEHQHLDMMLPVGATILSARVANNPAPYVRFDAQTGYWQIPLPPLSYTQISIIYQRSTSLGKWGTWSEKGPVFKNVPAITTKWNTYHPKGYRFRLEEGNLLGVDPRPLPGSFLDFIYSLLSTGQLPAHGILEQQKEDFDFISGETHSTLRGMAATSPGPIPGGNNRLQGDFNSAQAFTSKLVALDTPVTDKGKAIILPMHLEGHLVKTSKLGGEAELTFGYRNLAWWQFTKQAVFLLTLVCGLWIGLRHGNSAYWRYAGGGLLVLATSSDMAAKIIGWESPFLLIPACEALGALVGAGLLFLSTRSLQRLLSRSRKARLAALASLILFLGTSGTLLAQDEVLIPYETDEIGKQFSPGKVYLPYEKFRALWLLANPEMKKDKARPLADMVLGNGAYRLEIEDGTYRISGTIPLMVLTEKWVAVPLPFQKAQLGKILVDGKTVGVAQRKGVPFISIKGAGLRQIEVETTGAVINVLGSYSINARLLAGAAASLSAVLPAGAQPTSRASPAGLTFEKTPANTMVHMDIGSGQEVTLGWTFPRISGKQKARLESTSYSHLQLTLDGYTIIRSDAVKASGAPASSLRYDILGDWRITSVSSPDLSEWTVTEEDGKRTLSIFFSRPVMKSRLQIQGWAPLATEEPRQVAGLSLEGALSQAIYIGIRHGSRRRWNPDILSNQRASIDKIENSIDLPDDEPDRLYSFFESPLGQVVSTSALSGTADATTSATLFISPLRNIIFATTRYQVNVEGPLRQEVSLPPGWEFRNIEGDTVGAWHVIDSEDGPRLVILLTKRASNGTQVTWSAQQDYSALQEGIRVPLIQTQTLGPQLRSEKITWSIAAAEEIDVRISEGATGIEKVARIPDSSKLRLPPPSRRLFDMRSTGTTPSYNLELELGTRAGQPSARTVLFATAAEDFILVNGQVEISVTGGLQDTFLFRLPQGVTEESLRTRNLKSLTQAGDRLLQLTLTSGIVGKHNVTISYRIPRSPRNESALIEPVQVLRQDQSTADTEFWVGLIETNQALTNPEPAGLEKVLVADLPYLPEGVASESLQDVYRATRNDWNLSLKIEALRPGERAEAKVKLVDLVTVIGADGTNRTKAIYTITNRKLQFLRIELPADTQLWGATLNGNPMVVSQTQKALQVPLKHVGKGDLDLEVGIVYASRPADLPTLSGSLALEGPRVLGQDTEDGVAREVTVDRTLWRVELPDGYEAVLDGGNMPQVVSSIQYASKVESNLKDIRNLLELLGPKDGVGATGKDQGKLNVRQRKQAALSLKRLQQSLSDNVMDLEEENKAEGSRQFDNDDLNLQQTESRDQLRLGRQAQKDLEDAIRQNEKRKAPIFGKKEQAFEDSYNFKGNDWRRNTGPQVQKAPGESVFSFTTDITDLLYKTPFTGFRSITAPMKETEVEVARRKPVTTESLSPLPPSRINQVNPALESPPAPPRATSLTFRREAGNAVLVLKLSKKGHLLRFLSPAILLLIFATYCWRLGRKPKTAKLSG